jgi:hypothetical protein
MAGIDDGADGAGSGSPERDTPLPELIGYVLAATAIIVVGAFFQGPILNFICGPACVIALVAACSALADRRRSGRTRP